MQVVPPSPGWVPTAGAAGAGTSLWSRKRRRGVRICTAAGQRVLSGASPRSDLPSRRSAGGIRNQTREDTLPRLVLTVPPLPGRTGLSASQSTALESSTAASQVCGAPWQVSWRPWASAAREGPCRARRGRAWGLGGPLPSALPWGQRHRLGQRCSPRPQGAPTLSGPWPAASGTAGRAREGRAGGPAPRTARPTCHAFDCLSSVHSCFVLCRAWVFCSSTWT